MKLEDKLGLYLTAVIILITAGTGLFLYGAYNLIGSDGFLPFVVGLACYFLSSLWINKHL
jgi:hypothetical protein